MPFYHRYLIIACLHDVSHKTVTLKAISLINFDFILLRISHWILRQMWLWSILTESARLLSEEQKPLLFAVKVIETFCTPLFYRRQPFLKEFIENWDNCLESTTFRGGSKTTATSKMEHFVIIVNGGKPLTIITTSSTLDVAAVRDLPLALP